MVLAVVSANAVEADMMAAVTDHIAVAKIGS